MPNPIINRNIVLGGGAYVFSAQTITLFNSWIAGGGTLPSLLDQIQIDKLMRVIVTLPIDIFYNFAMGVTPVNVPKLFNWITPGSFTLTADGTNMNIGEYQGYTGNVAGVSIWKTGWIPNTHGVNYTLNSASIFSYIRTTPTAINGVAMGCENPAGAGTYTSLYPRLVGTNNTIVNVNDNNVSANTGYLETNWPGLIVGQTNSAIQTEIYKNGVSVVTQAVVHSAMPTVELYLYGMNNNGSKQSYFDGQCAMFGAGGKMTAAQNLILSNAINGYMTYYGTNVY